MGVAAIEFDQFGNRVQHHRHDQVAGELEIVGGPVGQLRDAREIDGELAREQLELGVDGAADLADTAVLFADQKSELCFVRVRLADQHRQRLLRRRHRCTRCEVTTSFTQHPAQGPHGVFDERDTDLFHRREVAIERRRNDARTFGDLTQADRGEAAFSHQLQGLVEQRLSSAAFLFGTRPRRVGNAFGGGRVTTCSTSATRTVVFRTPRHAGQCTSVHRPIRLPRPAHAAKDPQKVMAVTPRTLDFADPWDATLFVYSCSLNGRKCGCRSHSPEFSARCSK